MEPRKLRGAEIAKAGGLQQRGDHLWLVPSQSHAGKWMVDYADGEPTCTCPDYEKRSAFCKHIFAIEMHETRLPVPDAAADPGPTNVKYTQDWTNYNDNCLETVYAFRVAMANRGNATDKDGLPSLARWQLAQVLGAKHGAET